MRRQYRLTQKTLLAFLAGTGLPLVGRVASLLRWSSLLLGVLALAYGIAVLGLAERSLWNPTLLLSGALPSLVAAALFLAAHVLARRDRIRAAAVLAIAGLYALCGLVSWPRGPLAAAWLAQPFLALLAATCLGAVPGLTLTLVGVAALLGNALAWQGGAAAAAPWSHGASLAAVTLACGLVGVLVHELILAGLGAAEEQRQRMRDSRRALRHREKLLRHALRVETVGELAGMVVHQLRNHFQVMIGHVALGGRGEPEERAQRLTMIGEALQEARPLLDHLMRMAHPEDGDPAHLDLSDLAEAFCEKAGRVLPSVIELRLERSPRPLPVLIDGRGLEHALWNLALNARQAMGSRGVIAVSTGRDEDGAWIAVRDTGSGISEDDREKIFEPYFTTKPVGSGTGLGLTAVSRFVRASRGRIDVHSEEGEGSTFWLHFPLQSASTPAEAPPTPPVAPEGG